MPSKSILIVEDEKDVREVLAEIISMFGFKAEIECDGAAAWKKISRAKYDLIIADLGLPGLEGGQLLQMMRQKNIATPVLIMAGIDSKTSGMDFGNISGCSFIQKPFSIDDIRNKMEKLLAGNSEKAGKITV